MLSDKPEEYLKKGAEEMGIGKKSQQERNYRASVRNSVKEALEDFDTILANIELRDIEQIFYDPKPTELESRGERLRQIKRDNVSVTPLNETAPTDYIASVIGLCYLGTIAEEKAPGEPNPFANDPHFFERLVERGIVRAYKRRNQAIQDINVSIDFEVGPKAEEIDTDNLNDLSEAELGVLLDADKITLDEFLDAVEDGDTTNSPSDYGEWLSEQNNSSEE